MIFNSITFDFMMFMVLTQKSKYPIILFFVLVLLCTNFIHTSFKYCSIDIEIFAVITYVNKVMAIVHTTNVFICFFIVSVSPITNIWTTRFQITSVFFTTETCVWVRKLFIAFYCNMTIEGYKFFLDRSKKWQFIFIDMKSFPLSPPQWI